MTERQWIVQFIGYLPGSGDEEAWILSIPNDISRVPTEALEQIHEDVCVELGNRTNQKARRRRYSGIRGVSRSLRWIRMLVTTERLAEIEHLLFTRDKFAIFGDVAEELLIALREAQQQIQDFQRVLDDRDKFADALQRRVETLEKALGNLVTKLRECGPAINDAFLLRQIHIGPYSGPNYKRELEAGEAALHSEECPCQGDATYKPHAAWCVDAPGN